MSSDKQKTEGGPTVPEKERDGSGKNDKDTSRDKGWRH